MGIPSPPAPLSGSLAQTEGPRLNYLGFSAGSPGMAPPGGREMGGARGVDGDLKAGQIVGGAMRSLKAGRAQSSAPGISRKSWAATGTRL